MFPSLVLPLPQDGGSPALSGTCTIPVAVVDALDQAPQFTQNAYNFDLPENDYSAAVRPACLLHACGWVGVIGCLGPQSVRIGFIEAVDPDPTLDPGSAVTYSKRSRGAGESALHCVPLQPILTCLAAQFPFLPHCYTYAILLLLIGWQPTQQTHCFVSTTKW